MIKHLRLPFRFDVPCMQGEVRALEAGSWQDHYQSLHYEGGWRALPLRSLGGNPEDVRISPVPGAAYLDTPLLDACPYLREVLAAFPCPLQAVRLMKLEPSALIKEHRDIGLSAEQGEARFHIPIQTHPDVEFILGGDRLPLREGECWYLNFDLPHSVHNRSPMDRVHLVIDAVADDWVMAQLADPRAEFRGEMDPLDRFSPGEQQSMIESFRRMGTEASLKLAEDLERRLLSRP